MIDEPIHIKFQNSQNPNAAFDIIPLESLNKRKDINHSPFESHLVEFYLIILIENGNGLHRIDFKDYQFKKGTLLTIRKDQIQQFYKNDDVKGRILLFTDEFLISYLEKLEALKALQLFNEVLGEPKIQLAKNDFLQTLNLIERIEKEYFNINDEYSLGIIRSELHILIAKLFRIKSQRNELVSSRKYLSEFIDFQNLVENSAAQHKQVKYYAQLMGVSSKTLNTITRTIVNKSAKEFVDEICTKQIKRLLINTEQSVKEIAYAMGFEETTNFYKYFKRQTEITPEQFRNNAN